MVSLPSPRLRVWGNEQDLVEYNGGEEVAAAAQSHCDELEVPGAAWKAELLGQLARLSAVA